MLTADRSRMMADNMYRNAAVYVESLSRLSVDMKYRSRDYRDATPSL
jgi:hypothetical protein